MDQNMMDALAGVSGQGGAPGGAPGVAAPSFGPESLLALLAHLSMGQGQAAAAPQHRRRRRGHRAELDGEHLAAD